MPLTAWALWLLLMTSSKWLINSLAITSKGCVGCNRTPHTHFFINRLKIIDIYGTL